jgi:hypothetical protein
MFKKRDHRTLVYILHAATGKFCMRMPVLFADSIVKPLSHKKITLFSSLSRLACPPETIGI